MPILSPLFNYLIIYIRSQNLRTVKNRHHTSSMIQYTYNKYPTMRDVCVILIFVAALSCSQSLPVEDLVTHNITHLEYAHKWYSGYLNFSKSAYHYVFFDSQSQPDSDPLILWLNGGPGCSSLIGMVYENGPFIFIPNTTTLKANKHAWNKKANLLYISSPGGVGFSKGNRKVYDDGNTAEDNLEALIAFFNKFPNLRKNDFYITGESYSGIYVPYLAHQIINYNKLPSSRETRMNLKGIMVGNACTHPKECYDATAQGNSMYQYEFLYKHTYYTDREYDHLLAACTLAFHSAECEKKREQFDDKFGKTNSSILNIYAPCYYNVGKSRRNIHESIFLPKGDMDCDDGLGIQFFFNQPGIAESLHVDHVHFQQCSDYVADTYVSFSNASIWIYPTLIKEGLRVWVYSGDVDADVPITGTLAWIQMFKEEQGMPVLEPWREWWVHGLHKHEDQVGGMFWQLKGLSFVSVKGAGHMVPKDKPEAAQVLIRSFINGVEMPEKSQ